MIVRIGNGGHNFKGMDQYFGHDKGKPTKERIAWTYTMNMLTRDPDKAWKVMAYTAMDQNRLKMASGQKMTGNKLKKPVFQYALSWHPEQILTEDHIRETAIKSVEMLGLADYEVLMYRHKDEPHPHVHVVINRVHPRTGLAARLGNEKNMFSDFGYAYEKEHGKIYCKQREENHQKRKEGVKSRYADPHLLKAWNDSADGKSFIEALKKEGYHLAQGRKRVVIVDKYGKVFNPTRQLPGVKAKDLRAKLNDLNLRALFDAADLSDQIQNKDRKKYDERQKAEADKRSQQKPTVAEIERRSSAEPATPADAPPPRAQPSPEAQNRLQDRHLQERAKHFNHYQSLLEKEQAHLDGHYKINERQEAIKSLSERTAHPSWWRKVTGKAREDLLELRDLKRGHRDAQCRIAEQMGFWEKERARTLTVIHERQANEKAWLFENAAEMPPMRSIPNPAKVKARDLEHDK